ncbi:MAG: phage transcriptional regulator, AlpA [Burkholderiaceae bacterium]|nr:phage transcriptional regulator, AlpA [Burkholderiaceae bacterium]
MPQNILKLPAVISRTTLSKSSIYAGVKNGTFPAPIQLGARSVGWIESEISEFIQARIKASRPDAE